MTLFGSRDADAPHAAAAVRLARVEDGAAELATGTVAPDDARRVLLRLSGGEEIVVGTTDDRDEGIRLARRLMRLIDDAESQGEWPELDDRLIRPGAIVSIDVQRAG